jgi:hypothetical protein
VKDCKKAIATNPKVVDSYIAVADIYNVIGDHEQALINCDKAIEINASIPPPYINKAEAYYGLGLYEKGLIEVDKALKLKTQKSPEAYRIRACIYDKLGKDDLAKKDRDKIKELPSKGFTVVEWF